MRICTLASLSLILSGVGCTGVGQQGQDALDALTGRYRAVLDERAQLHWVGYQGAFRLLCADGPGAIYRVHGKVRGDALWAKCREAALAESDLVSGALEAFPLEPLEAEDAEN